MSRIAVISCIHGNIAALEAVYADIRNQKIGKVISLGDLVGYGPHPNEVVDFVARRNIASVRGCWDEAIAEKREDCGCRFATQEDAAWGHQAFVWTAKRLKSSTKKFLSSLEFAVRMRLPNSSSGILFVHGSPRSANEYLTESTHELVLFERAASGSCDVLVCGHTHVPFVRQVGGELRVYADGSHAETGRVTRPSRMPSLRSIRLTPKWIVNAGSVGEPRHGGPEATYVVIETRTLETEIRKVSYDFRSTIESLRRAGLPEVFGERLAGGREFAVKDKEIACAC